MSAYLLRQVSTGRYAELRPYDRAWTWLATTARHATPVSEDDASILVRLLSLPQEPVERLADPLGRVPVRIDVFGTEETA